jgi:chromosome segregation ATPase
VAIKELQDKITFAEEKGFKFEEEEEEEKNDEDKLSEDESNIDPNSEVLVDNFTEVKEDRNKLKQKITTWMNNYRHLNNKEPDENDKLEIKQLLDDYEHINKKYARMKFKLTKEGQIE